MGNKLVYKGFVGSANFSAEDRLFFGKVEGIRDLVAFEGATVDELEKSFKFMIDEHIKDCSPH